MSLLMLGLIVLSFVHPASVAEVSKTDVPSRAFEWTTASLFESNEAMLTSAGKEKVSLVIASLSERPKEVTLSITGNSESSARLDEWELSSARMASFARSLKANGLEGSAIVFGEQRRLNNESPQQLIVSVRYH
ncbi:OmpA family protein [Parasphingorhabdus litoris]|uniref:OmpA family protein n=1 Tax=Parasphingorhabdus litoris TaxID=394733 RepID=UPI001E63498B|nr:OmpA family protein [Parasphingorhabdus litoris]